MKLSVEQNISKLQEVKKALKKHNYVTQLWFFSHFVVVFLLNIA